jgi:hypothetical protein
MGNLIPVLCMLPFAATGIYLMVREEEITWPGVGLCAGALIVGWFAVNLFGFFGNSRLRQEIVRKVLAKAGRDASGGTFVGFARPSYVGLLDAHEDLGFLFLDKDNLEYFGEIHRVTLAKSHILAIRYRPNIHSALGLGRWVSIEAKQQDKPVRLLIEPRESPTLLANRRKGKELRSLLEQWRKS